MNNARTKAERPRISVVTATLHRPEEVVGLIDNLSRQCLPPFEIILVDGASSDVADTERAVASIRRTLPFQLRYVRHKKGTAAQRNAGIELATGDYVAFVDDDVRLEPDFFDQVLSVYEADAKRAVGGIVGYRTNQHFRPESAERWRWYRRLGLLTVFEPGRYDFRSGYPINANMQPPFSGVRPVDFMTTACAVWRRGVFDSGLRFDEFFCDYGVLEDAHFSLRAGAQWRLLQCGDARCVETHSPNGRIDPRLIGFKCVVNYYYVFRDIVKPLTLRHKFRFWRYQSFELLRVSASALRRWDLTDLKEACGRLEGFGSLIFGIPDQKNWQTRQS